jgi:hypothetical protein
VPLQAQVQTFANSLHISLWKIYAILK